MESPLIKECNPGQCEWGSVCKLVCRLIRGDIAASLLTNTLLTQEGGGAGKVLPISRKKVVRKDLADTQSETASVKKGHHHHRTALHFFTQELILK